MWKIKTRQSQRSSPIIHIFRANKNFVQSIYQDFALNRFDADDFFCSRHHDSRTSNNGVFFRCHSAFKSSLLEIYANDSETICTASKLIRTKLAGHFLDKPFIYLCEIGDAPLAISLRIVVYPIFSCLKKQSVPGLCEEIPDVRLYA